MAKLYHLWAKVFGLATCEPKKVLFGQMPEYSMEEELGRGSYTKDMEESIEELRQLWVNITPKDGTPCAYCGVYATDKEHVTPVFETFSEKKNYIR